jgi:Bacterial Ig-like domain (group 2)
MVTGRSSWKKLPLAGAFTLLLLVAFGAGCNGFFVNPTLTSITINGNTSVQVGSSTTLSAYGVNSDNSGSTLTSGVSWSSSEPTVAEITGACATGQCGSATIQGVSAGTSTITATSQSVSNSATFTVVFGSVTNYQVCFGTFGAGTSCSSTVTWNANATNNQVSQNFIAQGTSNGTLYDLTTTSTWTVVGSPTNISCDNSGSPAVCTVNQGTTAGNYTITVTYTSGTATLTSTINLIVTG